MHASRYERRVRARLHLTQNGGWYRETEIRAEEAARLVACSCGWPDHYVGAGPDHAEDCDRERAYWCEYNLAMDESETNPYEHTCNHPQFPDRTACQGCGWAAEHTRSGE